MAVKITNLSTLAPKSITVDDTGQNITISSQTKQISINSGTVKYELPGPTTFVGDDSSGTAVNAGETFKIAGAGGITTSVSGDVLTIDGTGVASVPGGIEPITFVGDDSTGTAVDLGETFKFAGTQNVSTAVSGDTLTITGPDLSTYLENVVEDTTPQLGGDLDLNSSDITGTGNINITGNITATEFFGPVDGRLQFTGMNRSGGTIEKGQVVYISGLNGNTPEVDLARANSSSTMPAFGIAVDDIADNAEGQIATFGSLRGLDVADFGETGITFGLGNTLYVSSAEAGRLTNVAPTGESNLIQNIGKIERATPTTNMTIKVGGAGRSNATPALNDGNIFIGNSSNQSSTVNLGTQLKTYKGLTVVGDDSTGTDINIGESFKFAGTQNVSTAVSNDTLTITGPDLSSYATTAYVDAQNQSQALTFVGDDSTGTAVNSGETFKIAGGTGITTAVSGDTLTITGVSQAQGLTFVGDDSTGTLISDGETVKIAGTQNITTAMSGDTLTITGPDLSTYLENVVEDTTPQLGGNLDVNGNQIVSNSNGDINLRPDGSGVVSLQSTTVEFGQDTTTATLTSHGGQNLVLNTDKGNLSGSITIAAGSNGAINIVPNGTGNVSLGNFEFDVDQTVGAGQDNYVLTYNNSTGHISLEAVPTQDLSSYLQNVVEDTTPELGGDLTLNGNDILGAGNINHSGNIITSGNHTVSGYIQNDAITIDDNKITTSRSNDDLHIETSGTGRIFVGDSLAGDPGAWSTAGSNSGNQFHYRNAAYNPTSSDYPNSRTASYTLSGGSSSNFSRIRMMDAIDVEMDGQSLTSTSNGTGIQIGHLVSVKNSTASTAQVNKLQANTGGAFFLGSGGQGTLDVEDMMGYRSIHQLSAASGDTIDINNAFGFYATPTLYAGNNATTTFNNEYFFYGSTGTLRATNTYGFYMANDAIANRLGGINFQSDQIQAADSNDDLKIAENGTGRVNMVVSTQGSAGTVAGYMKMKVNGTEYAVPYYNLT